MRRFGKRTVVVLAVVVAASVAAVAGYAFWTSTGTGSGNASTGTAGLWQVTSQSPSGASLVPGGPAQTVQYTVTNTGAGDQVLAGVTVSVANDNGSAWTPLGGCTAADFSVNGQSAGSPHFHTALAQTFGPGGSSSATVSVRLVETGGNQNGCQGKTVPLYFVAS
jgi:hypothetical protein